jgi:four helix bundle protein
MSNYKELQVWQKSIELVLDVYKLVKELPSEERDALGDQMRRVAVSIPSNIAEGYARESTKEFRHFLRIASGSLAELNTQLVICQQLNYCTLQMYNDLVVQMESIDRMLVALRKRLET